MFNFQDKDFLQNPYPVYSLLRENGPVWIPLNEDYDSSGLWIFGRYCDAIQIFKDVSHTSKALRLVKHSQTQTPFDLHVLNRNSADHLRLRTLSSSFFSINSLKKLEIIISHAVDDLEVSLLQKRGQIVNLVSDFCELLPIQVIAHLMGLPSSEMFRYRKWAKSVLVDSLGLSEVIKINRNNALLEMSEYFSWVLSSKEYVSEDGLLNHYLKAYHNGEISKDEFIGMAGFMLLAGHETTIDFLGNGFWLLNQHPDQLKLLIESPQICDLAINEILRFESPNQRSTYRVVTREFEISGKKILPGEQIAVFIGSANRDEEIFDAPDLFDIRRHFNPHIAFGTGIHVCQGRNLAKLEARIAFIKLAPLLARLEPYDSSPNWKKSSFLRGLESFQVRIN